MGKAIIPFIIIFLLVSSSFGSVSYQTENVTIEKTSSIPVDGPMDSAWPMQCHDLHHTGRSPYSTADNQGLEKWRFKCDGITGHVDGGIIIGDDGTLYFGDYSWQFIRIKPQWEFEMEIRNFMVVLLLLLQQLLKMAPSILVLGTIICMRSIQRMGRENGYFHTRCYY